MSSNFNPNTIAKLANLSEEHIAEILNTRYTAADIAKQQKALEQLKEQLCNPKQVTIEGWVARDKSGPTDLGLRIYTAYPRRMEGLKRWNGKEVNSVLIDHRLFPSITWDSEPQKVRITITPIEE